MSRYIDDFNCSQNKDTSDAMTLLLNTQKLQINHNDTSFYYSFQDGYDIQILKDDLFIDIKDSKTKQILMILYMLLPYTRFVCLSQCNNCLLINIYCAYFAYLCGWWVLCIWELLGIVL